MILGAAEPRPAATIEELSLSESQRTNPGTSSLQMQKFPPTQAPGPPVSERLLDR